MATLITSAPENLNTPEQMQQQQRETVDEEDAHGDEFSDYEMCREERIRENRERMQKLGILDLSQKLNALKPTPVRAYRRKTPGLHSPLPPSSPAPIRRSSRLQNSTPVSYCEVLVDKNKSSKDGIILREEGSRPEVYTEEHEKLLGSTEMSWTLFVDGYGKDGKRIYDPVNGKTCHQCRQKTLGHRTHCSQCSMVQGQFCGDCLYMRYGENVLEAKANPDWICPVCRGICNCSLCRQAKGWPPTGMLYKKITSLGYKSAAHYLIQTRRANTDTEKNAGSKVPVSAKRSLPFSDIELTREEDDLSKPSSESLNPIPVPLSDKDSRDGVSILRSAAKSLLNPDNATLSKDHDDLCKPISESLNSIPVPLSDKDYGDGISLLRSAARSLLNPDNATLSKDHDDLCKPTSESLNSIPVPLSDKDSRDGISLLRSAARSLLNPDNATLSKDHDDLCKPISESLISIPVPLSDKDSSDGISLLRSAARSLLNPDNATLSKDHNEHTITLAGNEHEKSSTNGVTAVEPKTTALEGGDVDEIKEEKFVPGNKDVVASPKSTRKRVRCEPTPDSIAGRMRMRRKKANTSEEMQFVNSNSTTSITLVID